VSDGDNSDGQRKPAKANERRWTNEGRIRCDHRERAWASGYNWIGDDPVTARHASQTSEEAQAGE